MHSEGEVQSHEELSKKVAITISLVCHATNYSPRFDIVYCALSFFYALFLCIVYCNPMSHGGEMH